MEEGVAMRKLGTGDEESLDAWREDGEGEMRDVDIGGGTADGGKVERMRW